MSPTTSAESTAVKFLRRPQPIGVTGTITENIESLSSWLHRLAQENGLDEPLRLVFRTMRYAPVKVERLLVNSAYLADLAGATGIATDKLLMMAFPPPNAATAQKGPFSLPAWLLRRKSGVTPHVVCPICVSEDSIPYWRRSWRLSVTVECPIHGTPMAEKCSACHRRFALYRKAVFSLDCCTWCGAPIQGAASRTKAQATSSIWRGLSYGLPHHKQPSDVEPVFDDLRVAVRIFSYLLRYAQAGDASNHWFHRHAGSPLPPQVRSNAKIFPDATIDERRQVLQFVATVMSESRDDFHELVRNTRILQMSLELLSFTVPTCTKGAGNSEGEIV